MYLFLGRLKLDQTARVIGAVIFAFSGPMIVWHNWEHTYVSAFAPLLFYFVDRVVVSSDKKAILYSIGTLTVMLYAGMPPYVAYFLYLLGTFVLFRLVMCYKSQYKQYIEPIFSFILIVLFAVGLSFAYTGTLLHEISQLDYLSQRNTHYQVTLNAQYWVTFFYPNHYDFSMEINEYASYLGLIPLFIIVNNLFLLRKNIYLVFFQVIFGLLLVSIYSHAFDGIIRWIPVVNTSLKPRLLILLAFSGSIASAIGFQYLRFTQFHKKSEWTSLMIIMVFLYYYWYRDPSVQINSILLLLLVAILIIFSYRFKNQRTLIIYAFIVMTYIDLFHFGADLLPTVNKGATNLLKTESITYVEDNADLERVIGVGNWTLFPNTSVFYDLYDLRAHNFIVTSSEMHDVMEWVSPSSYASPTRTIIESINSVEPLSMSSVSYILSDHLLGSVQLIGHQQMPIEPVGEITQGFQVEQRFIPRDDGFSILEVLPATYLQDFKNSNATANFTLINEDTQKVIFEQSIQLKDILDNQYLMFEFKPQQETKGNHYRLIITSDAPKNQAITVWKTQTDVYQDGQLILNGIEVEGDLVMKLGYSSDSSLKFEGKFNDGVYLYRNTNANPRVYISHQPVIAQSSEQVMDLLKQIDLSNQIVVEGENIHSDEVNFDSTGEFATIKNYQPNRVLIETNLNTKGFLVLTDQYFPGWRARVDGEEVEIYRTNRIFRSIELEAGTHEVEFYFQPQVFYKNVAISLGTLLVLLLSVTTYTLHKRHRHSQINR